MESSFWNLSSLVFKLVIYAGFANAVAIPAVMTWAQFNQTACKSVQSMLIKSTVLALIAVVGYFFIQVGVMSESGLSGMFDQFMIQLVWGSSIGISTLYRFLALVLMLFVAMQIPLNKSSIFIYLYGLSLVFIGLSFCSSGHVSELSYLAQVVIAIHVLIAFWWMGSFYPLLISCRQSPISALSNLMHKFGQIAAVMVAILIIAGTYLAFELTGGFAELTTTRYGQVLIIKLILVTLILLLAAYHKYKVVPSLLTNKKSRKSLIASIKIEMYLGASILVTTGILTTLLGPGHH